MKKFTPKRPTGDTPEAMFMQALWDNNFGPESKFNDTDTVKWSHTTKGKSAHAKPPKGAKPSEGFKLFRVQSETFEILNCKEISIQTDGSFAEGNAIVTVLKPDGLGNFTKTVTYLGMEIQYSPLQLTVDGVPTTAAAKRFSRWINASSDAVTAGLNVAYKEVVWPPYLDTYPVAAGSNANNLIWAFKRWDGQYVDANLMEGGTGQVRQWMKEIVVCTANGTKLALMPSTHVYDTPISFSSI